jgi:hypothetical protein
MPAQRDEKSQPDLSTVYRKGILRDASILLGRSAASRALMTP